MLTNWFLGLRRSFTEGKGAFSSSVASCVGRFTFGSLTLHFESSFGMTRKRAIRLLVALVVVALLLIVGAVAVFRTVYVDRYYMPGPLGQQTVRRSTVRALAHGFARPRFSLLPPVQQAFFTRAIGLRAGEEAAWGAHNGITPALQFSHHLAQVFPPSLFAKHPEFFPLVDGKRFEPPPGYGYWNPDLGREDVALFAAQQASAFFDGHPSESSFSLGVNDGLLFGESPETVALVGLPEDGYSLPVIGDSGGPTHQGPRVPEQAHSFSAIGVGDRSSALPAVRPVTGNGHPRLRYFRGRPDYSRLVFTFMNRTAGELAKTHPDKYLGCLAYYWAENTPGFAIDPHVIRFLTADRAQSYDPAFRAEEFALQERWAPALGAAKPINPYKQNSVLQEETERTEKIPSGLGSDAPFSPLSPVKTIESRIGLYDYLDGQGFLVPRVPIHAFAEHIKHAHAVGFTDYYGESSRNWGLDGPLPWVVAQLLQDPGANVEALLTEYYTQYFGAAAEPMRRFFERCEAQWMGQTGPSYWLKYYRNADQVDLFPPDVCRQLRTLLHEAEAAAAGRDPSASTDPQAAPNNPSPVTDNRERAPRAIAERVRFVSDSFRVTEAFVAFEGARREMAVTTLHGAGAPGRDLLAAYRKRRDGFIRTAHDVTARWPLAFYPINYDDWLRDDPAYAAERALGLAGHDSLSVTGSSGRSDPNNERPITNHLSGTATAINGTFTGPLRPGLRVAGLQFGMDLPAPWMSKLEPTETAVATLQHVGATESAARHERPNQHPASPHNQPAITDNRSDAASLHFSGQENATVYQWAAAQPGTAYAAAVDVRGEVSSSDVVLLTIGWLDSHQRAIGLPKAMRLPMGKWPTWVTLRQACIAPSNAAWVGIGVRIQHQVPGDWADVRDFGVVVGD